MFSQSSPSVVLRERSLSADAKQQVRARVTSILHRAGLWSHTAVCVRVHCRCTDSVHCWPAVNESHCVAQVEENAGPWGFYQLQSK